MKERENEKEKERERMREGMRENDGQNARRDRKVRKRVRERKCVCNYKCANTHTSDHGHDVRVEKLVMIMRLPQERL